MKMTGQPLHFAAAKGWRAWLERHHATEGDAWLMIHKTHSGTRSVTVDQAVEEALCFGWIDSSMQPIHEERYALRFTPEEGEQLVQAQQGTRCEVDRGRADDRSRPRHDRGGEAEREMGERLKSPKVRAPARETFSRRGAMRASADAGRQWPRSSAPGRQHPGAGHRRHGEVARIDRSQLIGNDGE